jgi:uncharacterized protein (TIGR02444 family)
MASTGAAMTNEIKTAITPFWRFSLNFYRQTGVSDACIALQDGCGIDVNLLLFLFWLASEGRQLSAEDVKKLDDQVRSWRELTIIPIRDTRRKLKGAKTFVDPRKQEALRDKVKAVELEAEKLQQEALYAFTQSGPLGKPSEPPAAARGNVAAFERAMGASFPKASVDVLVNAFDGLTGR